MKAPWSSPASLPWASRQIICLACLILAGVMSPSRAQDAPNESGSATQLSPAEKKFQESLTGATFGGRWCAVKDGKLEQEFEDHYTLHSAKKIGGDKWLIYARVEYGKRDVTVPIPVQLAWAGDTPVIVVKETPIPGLGTYSARVLIFGDTYAGVWSGDDHGGQLHGVITRPSK